MRNWSDRARYIFLVLIFAGWLIAAIFVVSLTASADEIPVLVTEEAVAVEEVSEAPGEAEKIDEAITRDLTYAGTFTITAYSADFECCGKYPDDPAYGITASGTTATEGITVASDWNVLPAGTVIYIDGIGNRVVEDNGGAINGQDLDLYFEDYDDAVQWGVRERDVWIVGEVRG